MITEDFVSRETAILLKEKGFHEPVRYEYHYYNTTPSFHRHLRDFNGQEYDDLQSEWYSAPTHQMVLKWLREVHNIHISAWIMWHGKNYGGNIAMKGKDGEYHYVQEYHSFNSYEDVIEAAIQYALKTLI